MTINIEHFFSKLYNDSPVDCIGDFICFYLSYYKFEYGIVKMFQLTKNTWKIHYLHEEVDSMVPAQFQTIIAVYPFFSQHHTTFYV